MGKEGETTQTDSTMGGNFGLFHQRAMTKQIIPLQKVFPFIFAEFGSCKYLTSFYYRFRLRQTLTGSKTNKPKSIKSSFNSSHLSDEFFSRTCKTFISENETKMKRRCATNTSDDEKRHMINDSKALAIMLFRMWLVIPVNLLIKSFF